MTTPSRPSIRETRREQVFPRLTAPQLAAIMRLGERRTYPTGATLFTEGERHLGMFCRARGRDRYRAPHGRRRGDRCHGDTPNVAARVQSVAEADTVLIIAATQRLVAGLFVVEERGAQQLKGVPQPVVLYRVSCIRAACAVGSTCRRAITPPSSAAERAGVLADAWERVVEGMGQTVFVQAAAGIAKSRLCHEVLTAINNALKCLPGRIARR